MKDNEEINGLLAKHFSHEPLSTNEQEALEAWIRSNADEYQQLKEWMDTPLETDSLPDFNAEKAWNKIEGKLEEKPRKVLSIKWKRNYSKLAFAASVALIAIIGILYNVKTDTKEALKHYAYATNGINHFLLPDSTEVTLYPNTRLTYESGNTREVTMEGKAFFHVKKDRKPFRITVSALSIEVLGTSFLVDAQEQAKAGVFVKNGIVRVTTERQETTLTANEQVEVANGSMKTGRIDNAEELFGENATVLTFTHTPLSEAVQEIEKHTGIRIELDKGFEQDAITTRLKPDNINNILKELTFICGCKCDTVEKGKHYRLYYE
ncbi:MAG: FecR domain-containing protein [Bacteroides sp.]|nr:FecR domain-containing protein [Bacteroides sp.]